MPVENLKCLTTHFSLLCTLEEQNHKGYGPKVDNIVDMMIAYIVTIGIRVRTQLEVWGPDPSQVL